MKARLEIYVSRTRTVGLLLLTCVMVGCSYFCTTLSPLKAQIAGWAGVCFFSLGFVVLPRQLMQTRPQFVVDEHGLEDRRSRFGLIEWNDIVGLSVGSIHGQKFLCVEVADSEKYVSRLTSAARAGVKANGVLGFPPITIGFGGLSQSAEDVIGFIEQNHRAEGRERAETASP